MNKIEAKNIIIKMMEECINELDLDGIPAGEELDPVRREDLSKRYEALRIAYQKLQEDIKVIPRYETFKNNKDFFNELEKWVETNKDSGKSLDDFREYVTESIEVER